MSESLKAAVRGAILRLLNPLVRVLLQAGIGVGEFTSLAKIAYIRAAVAQGREAGGEQVRPNVSRISVVTGLTRIEVTAILKSEGHEPAAHKLGWQRAERVLTGWWNDSDFQNERGLPEPLPMRGKRKSFAALCKRYSGENRAGQIFDELLRVRAIKLLADGRVQAISRTYATVRWNPDGIEALGVHLSEHCATLLHNLENPAKPRLLRRVVNTSLNPLYRPLLVRDIEQQAESFADSVDNALNDRLYTVTESSRDAESMQLGIAIYVFEEPPGGTEVESGGAPGSARRKRARSSGV